MESDRLAEGLAIRRRVLGDDHVAQSLTNATDVSRPLQEFIGECCWGTVWTRPGLPLRTRSLLTIAMLTALGNVEELKLHTRGALRNGCTKEEIGEALLQAAIYCGAPAALEASRAVQSVLDNER